VRRSCAVNDFRATESFAGAGVICTTLGATKYLTMCSCDVICNGTSIAHNRRLQNTVSSPVLLTQSSQESSTIVLEVWFYLYSVAIRTAVPTGELTKNDFSCLTLASLRLCFRSFRLASSL